MFFSNLSLIWNIVIFLSAAAVVTVAGIKTANVINVITQRTGMGNAMGGLLLLGGSTSLAALATSVTASINNNPNLAFSNALGGITAAVAFTAIADMVYRKQSLMFASASVSNLIEGGTLVALLGLVLMALALPAFSIWSVNVISIVLVFGYLYGLQMASKARTDPMWVPKGQQQKKQQDNQKKGEGKQKGGMRKQWLLFAGYSLAMAAGGWVIAGTGTSIANDIGISQTVLGALFTGIATSLDSFVTVLATISKGKPTLAIGGIIGGNAFSVLILTAADIAYRSGSIYHNIDKQQTFLLSLAVVLTGVQLMGLLRRRKREIFNIAYDSLLIFGLYALGIVWLFFAK